MTPSIRIGLVAACLVIGSVNGHAEGDITASINPPVVPYTAAATLSVTVHHDAGVPVSFGTLADADKKLTLRTPAVSDVTEDGETITTLTCVVEGLEEGRYALKPLSVTIGQGEAREIPLPGVHIRALTPAEEEAVQKFADNMGLIDGPMTPRRRGMWLAAAAGVLAGVVATALWFLRRRRAATFEPPRKSWEVALERLAALERAGLGAQGKTDAFYVYLSDIARQYIEARFAIHAPERTTPEFLLEASKSGALRAEHEALLARFMRQADRVKFARYTPTAEEMDEHLQEIRRFVEETVIRETPASDAKGAAA